jgi:hypothetical protein
MNSREFVQEIRRRSQARRSQAAAVPARPPTRLDELEAEKAALVQRYQRDQRALGRELTYGQAEAELANGGGPAPFTQTDRDVALSVSRRTGTPYQLVVDVMQGRRPERYEMAKLPPAEGPPPDNLARNPDPAARSPDEISRAMENPRALTTLDGEPAITGGKVLDGPTARRLLQALQRRRENGEPTLTWSEILEEFLRP